MKPALKILILTLALSLVFAGASVSAQNQTGVSVLTRNDSDRDFHIDKDGNVSMYQGKIIQVSGTTFYARYYIGLAYIRMIIKTDANTKIRRRFGDEIALKEIKEGDIINVFGKMESGADSISIIAKEIVNFSNQKEITDFKGVITGNGSTTASFILKTLDQNTITINTAPSTQIKKGNRILTLDRVQNGDIIINTVGTFDHTTKTLDANVLVIYTDMSVYKKRNFEGTFKAVSGTNPLTLLFTAEGKEYSVVLKDNAEIMNQKRKSASIKRFVSGDTVRIYGAIREVDEPIIDAEIIRNLNL